MTKRGFTFVEVLAFNVPRARGLLDVAVLTIAVLAPTLAAVLLWNARAHRAPVPETAA